MTSAGADRPQDSEKTLLLEEMARRAYEAWRKETQPEWSDLSPDRKARWFSAVGAAMDVSSFSRARIAAIAECSSMIETSYPDHACTPAVTAAIRSLSTSHAFPDAISDAGGIDGLARHLASGDHPISDGAWRISLVRSDMTVYARRAIEWFGANVLAGHRPSGGM